MEILAPAGSKESFISAINAGADAVYLGTKKFNARIGANNLNFYDLQVLTDYAKNKNVKVYVTFNTLIKHEEISEAIKTIEELKVLNIDGIIVQDLGIARIVKEFYPEINLHGSTQLNIHNSKGAEILAENNFKRVVLSRELTFAEMKNIAKSVNSKIELEIFVHGALCFCVSGLCLFSSFIGGFSGNRGLCTQPCRRIWQSDNEKGFLFSPKDFQLADFVNDIKNIGIKSLKIEGRMRSSEYVYKTVRAYKILAEAKKENFNEALIEAKNILADDFARKKTTCLVSGRDSELFEAKKSQCLGKEIGKLANFGLDETGRQYFDMKVFEKNSIEKGDRIRIYSTKFDKNWTFKSNDYEFFENGIEVEKICRFTDCLDELFIFLKDLNMREKNIDSDFLVFKLGDKNWIESEKILNKEIDRIYNDYKNSNNDKRNLELENKNNYTSLISRLWNSSENKNENFLKNDNLKNENLWIRFDENFINIWDTENFEEFLKRIEKTKNLNLILSVDKSNYNSFKNFFDKVFLENKFLNKNHLVIEFPAWISQRDFFNIYKTIFDYFMQIGIKRIVANNLSQIKNFFSDKMIVEGNESESEVEKISGSFLYVWNGYSARFLKDNGFSKFITSWEDDFLNIRRLANSGVGNRLIIPIFGFPVITRSIMLPKNVEYGKVVSDKKDISFIQLVRNEQNLLIPENPIMIFNAIDKLKNCGIKDFLIDFSFCEFSNSNSNSNSKTENKKSQTNIINLKEILDNFEQNKNFDFDSGKKNLIKTLKFNFKQGVI